MASEDVIELGSSDEEAEAAPKKMIPRKNKPNAMVHIPPGLAIMASSKANTNVNPIKNLIGKGVTVTKVNKPSGGNKQSGAQKKNPPLPVRNGKSSKPSVQPLTHNSKIPIPGGQIIKNIRPINPNIRPINPNIKVTPRFINPISLSKLYKGLNRSNVIAGNRPNIVPLAINNLRPKLPSSITLKKTTPDKNNTGNKNSAVKRPTSTNMAYVNKKRKMANVQSGEVMTVDLEDDETPAVSTASPQWYIRPEEGVSNDTSKETNNESSNVTEEASNKIETTIEEKNNSEPTKFIEITIDDSPIKPVPKKNMHEIGAELAITIDDSPAKLTTAKPTTSTNSDNESQETEKLPKHSKKKLNYPKDIINTIEIELEPINSEELQEHTEETQSNEQNVNRNNEIVVIIPDNVIEVIESPAKAITSPNTPRKDKRSTQARVNPIQIFENNEPGEFHPVYQEFIDLCIKLENSNDMQTIVEKKIKNYYKQVPKDYTESEEFLELVQSKIMAMKAGPEKLYLYIKDVVDELNLQRKMAKAHPTVKETKDLQAEKFQYGEESEFDPKRQRQIRKLEKTLKKLHRAIQKLEEQEVDFDDEDDSVYLLTERYKERMVRVHAKFCQLTNTKMPSEPRIRIDPRPGQPNGPAKRLQKWVNKKVPIGTPLPFPDFHDVLRCVREANEEDKLGWNEADIMEEARDLFMRCGKKLQRRRQENEWRLAASRISLDVDPAENNDELKKKLETNKQLAAKKETDVFNKYADKQSLLKLEAEEIGDKEAELSPGEEEDDDEVEEVQVVEDTLDYKQRRKETIRKLLKSKKKMTDKKTSSKDYETKTKTASKDFAKNKGNDASEMKNNSINSAMDVDAAPEEINKDSTEVESNLDKSKESKEQSSDENKVDSDMDELHLLQKLHSDEINTSTADTTDSESPINISDTLSSGDNKKPSSDVISIENSSYSESEKNEDTSKNKKMDIDNEVTIQAQEKNVPKTVKFDNQNRLSGEIECASFGVQINKTNNDEYNESVESILLGTSDEDTDENDKTESPKSNDDCVNLKDDAISIGETAVQAAKKNNTKTTDTVVESPPSDAKTIKDIPESILDSDEAKSVETLTEEHNNSVTKELKKLKSPVDNEDYIQKSGKAETRDVEMDNGDHPSQSATDIIKVVIEPVTSENSKSPERAKNSAQDIHDSCDSTLKLGQKESSNDTLLLDTIEPCVKQIELEIETVQNCSSLDKQESNSNEEASRKNNSPKPKDNVTVKESSRTIDTKEPAESTENVLKSDEIVDSGKNTESLDSMIKDLQSDLGMDDNLETTSVDK